jgi:VWFA-related protein
LGQRGLSLVLFAGLPVLVALKGQNAPSQQPIIRSDVREVTVPVVVTDKAGQYVKTLGRDDFQVFENGKPQKIVAFSRTFGSPSSVSEAKAVAGHAAVAGTMSDAPKRTYLICIDTLHASFGHFAQVRQALAAYFRSEQADDAQDIVAVLGRQMQVVLDSTRSPAAVLKAVENKALLKTFQDSEAASIAHEMAQFNEAVGSWCGGCQCTSLTMDVAGMQCPALKGRVLSQLYSFAERASVLDGFFIRELKEAVTAMSRMPTERTVLLLSDGFSRFPGEELYAVLRDNNVADLNLRMNPHDLQPQVNAVLMLAEKFDVRFYTIDSRGLYSGAEVPGTGESAEDRGGNPGAAMKVAWLNGDISAQLARETGGEFFENSNDLLKGIRKTFEDGRQQYVLVYSPSKPKPDNKFRKIVVKVDDKSLHVAAKAGYWANR